MKTRQGDGVGVRGLLLVLVLGGLAACGGEEKAAAPSRREARTGGIEVPGDAPSVIFLGDSISAGLHLERPLRDAFPAVIQRRLVEEGIPFKLTNAGVSGDTTAGGLRRLPWMLKQKPDLLVVELGANDGLRGIALDSVRSNLRGIVKGALGASVPVVLLGMRLPPNLGAKYTESFAKIYREIATEFDAPFVPFFMEGVAGVADLNFPDGIHPNREGHDRLAAKVLPTVRTALKALRR